MNEKKLVVHGGYVEAGQAWQFKRNRGTGSFTVVAVKGRRITLRAMRGVLGDRTKTIGVNTLRGDYERVS